MSTTTTRTRHTTVALKLPLSVPALITYAKGMVTRMTANPSFPNLTPTLAAITAAIDDLQAAEAAALARTKGAVTTRNGKQSHPSSITPSRWQGQDPASCEMSS